MSILLTKVRAPQRRKDILHRVRLVDTIHQNLHRKLTYISAPAGYGKTTLLIDFANDVDAIVCWYLISPQDRDLVEFTRHIVAAFQQQIPQFGKELEEALSMPTAEHDPASLAAEIINEVERRIDDFCVLVLDDYHLAGENEVIVDFIENLLEHLPDHLRILIGSRSVYGIPTANLYIRDELITIGAEELRFRAEELQRLVRQNYHVRLSQEQANELAKRADGWIVALLLAIRSMDNGAFPKFAGATEQVYEYLAEEVVSRLDSDLRKFMYATSLLGDFDEALCNFVLESEDSGDYLRALEERNLFVTRTETSEGLSYRYHQLFAEFLQDHFKRNDPEQMKQLHSRVADWFKELGQWETAIRHKLKAQEYAEAAKWIDLNVNQFYTNGRHSLLEEWHDSLEESGKKIEKLAPRLLLFQAKTMIERGEYQRAEQLLDKCTDILRKNRDTDSEANALVTRGMMRLFEGKHKEALSLAKEAQAILAKKKLGIEGSQQFLQAERLKGLPSFYLGQREEAIKHVTAAADGFRELIASSSGSQKLVYRFNLALSLTDLGLISISSGNIFAAQKAFEEALDINVKARSNQGALALARNNIAYILHQGGRYKSAWKEYSLALENARASKQPRVQIGILNGQGGLLFDIGEFDEAESLYRKAIAIGESIGEKQALDASYVGLTEIERMSGNHSEAMTLLRDAASLGGHNLNSPFYCVRLGNIYLDMGQLDLAQEQLEKVLKHWEETGSLEQNHVLAAFLLFCALSELGDGVQAERNLEKSLKGAAQLGYDQFLVLAARSALDSLGKMQAAAPSSQLKDLLKRAKAFKASKSVIEFEASEKKVLSMHLEISAFGPDEVRKDGERLPASAWRSTRAKALFYYIIDRQKVRKEDVGLDFWPDFSPGKISSNFHATLWRVRQAIGDKDVIVFEEERYSLHPSITYWYDVAEFEDYLHQAGQPNHSDSERAELLRQAEQLYKGEFLPDIYFKWADERRDELQKSYLQALIQLAELELKKGHYGQASNYYEKVLSLDQYRDKVHMALMDCLVQSGATSAAKAHFHKYKAMLREELNVEPIQELQSYYDKLAI